MPRTYRLRIARGENQFEAEGDRKFVLEMLAKHGPGAAAPVTQRDTLPPASKPIAPQVGATMPAVSKKISAGEFIRQFGFKKHTDMVLAFGYYLEKMSGASSFTAADINTCYYEAKLETSNTSQMMIQNIRSGRIMEGRQSPDKKKRAFVLTRTGEEFIEKKLAKPGK